MMRGVFPLVKLILRRDRVKLPIWIFAIVLTAVSMPLAMHATMGSASDLADLQQHMSSGSAILSLISGTFQLINGNAGLGSLTLIKAELFTAVLIAFFVGLLVIRHTRANEESGASEMILSGEVSRKAPLTAAILAAVSSLLIIVVLTALGMYFSVKGISGGWGRGAPTVWNGSWLFALEMGGIGLAFTGIAAIAAQLAGTSAGANAIFGGIIGLTYISRGIGDVFTKNLNEMNIWSWFSPFGWGEMTRSLTFANWKYLLIFAIMCPIFMVIGYFLLSKRDLGSGILPARKGRSRASKILRSKFGLAWHEQKTIFISWLIGNLVLVAVIGGMSNEIQGIYSGSDIMKGCIASLGGSTGSLIVKTMLVGMLTYVAAMTLAFAIQCFAKMRSDESSGRLEILLSTKTSRYFWLAKNVFLTLACSVLMLGLSGFVVAVSANLSGAPEQNIAGFTFGTMAYFPVMVLAAGIYVLLFGILPRLAGAICWALFSVFLFLQMFLSLFVVWLNLPKDFANFLPLGAFAKIASDSGTALDWQIFYVVLISGILLFLVGIIFWRQRDIKTGE